MVSYGDEKKGVLNRLLYFMNNCQHFLFHKSEAKCEYHNAV